MKAVLKLELKVVLKLKLKSPVQKDQVLLPQYNEGSVAKLSNLWHSEHPGPECHHLNHEDEEDYVCLGSIMKNFDIMHYWEI